MWFRMLHAGRAVAVIAALVFMFAATSRAQTDTDLTASLEPLKISLDLIEGSVPDARNDQALADLAGRVAPLRDELGKKIATLESRFARAAARVKKTRARRAPTTPRACA